MSNSARLIFAAIASPLALALLWSALAIGTSGFWPLLGFNAVVCFSLFFLCAAVSHLILRRKGSTRLWDYLRVMFWVATVILAVARIALMQWIFREGGEEFHLGTQVISNGHFTVAGLLLSVLEAMFGAAWLSASFGLFWALGVRSRTKVPT
jgi:hypothetical protein